MDDDAVSVVEDRPGERYVVQVGADVAGFAAYKRAGDRTVFTHTEVDERFQGRGLASQLIRGALDAERVQGRAVEPRCPFVARFIGDHPEYHDLVPAGSRKLVPPGSGS